MAAARRWAEKAVSHRIDETAQLFDTICVSAGRRGLQVELRPDDLCAVIGAEYADLTE